MDVHRKLGLIVKLIAPPNASFYITNSITDELTGFLQSHSRTIPRLESLIFGIKSKLGVPAQHETIWKTFEDILFPLVSMNDPNEMILHLDQGHQHLQTILHTTKSVPLGTTSMSLNPENLENHSNNSRDHLMSPSVYAESFETLDKFSDRRSLMSSVHNYGPSEIIDNTTLKDLIIPYYSNTVPEKDILKSIPYTLLGITSEMFPVANDIIIIPFNIPNAISGQLHLLFEGGLIYRNISSRIEYYKHVNISPLKQALVLEVEKYMNIYSGLVNQLATSGHIGSLSALYTNLYDPIIQLRTYYFIMHKFQILRGDEILSLLNALKTHGDKSIQNICSKFYHNLIHLYFKYLKDWLLLGKLDDTYKDEFFIKRDETSTGFNFIIPFIFDKPRIPKFLPENTTYKIYMIGKTYIFITDFCKELQWANDFTKKYSYRYESLDCFSASFSNQLIDLVNEQYLEIVKYSYFILKSKFYYEEILYMLKDVLLMGRCDFMDVIFLKSESILNQQVKRLRNYAFTRILQESIEESSLRSVLRKNDNNFLVEKIDARLLNMGQDLLGWDVFTLDYVIHPPLSTVLNVNRIDGRKEYLQIFNFLWRFKRIDFFNNKSMLDTKKLIRSFKKNTQFSPFNKDITSKLSKLSLLRSEIQQFNYKIENYYLQFVIEKNFKSLLNDLQLNKNTYKTAGTIDSTNFVNGNIRFEGILKPKNDLLMFGITDNDHIADDYPNIENLNELHNKFLNDILGHKLFSSTEEGKHSKQPYSRSLIFIFEEILQFIDHYSSLCEIAYNIFLQINLQNNSEVNTSIELFNTRSHETIHIFKRFKRATYMYITDLRDDGDNELAQLSRMLR
ncbi:similar to Saccharomyces cerevisiae YNL126W SPC98 Component of the microtubule-nucleating Tub4p (gamma-tubulin) complex [Maudiozyma barnettii]|uniref:Spindle pole body component n=1 Tax=Maudiozyma barnettii TaxID=61262 RepID=A0A8H2VBQ9_9SACH|nr:Spc98p [Kazachstania barnettii]CAB4252312.1 similar to Saccharomyces cerevisiae YNL126W SPC98 Component of the microtubule-nucleating Tub4p (gamma-tubulin) complex [Kazachstania barnettii]CAD1779043.1 similar to Saccharomyces cerevisiae YNL126W SPC98 Component of the microtubule-nucleating Tub4p (gamma-tubulin) complex [Kazachstania barnettii]